MKPAPVRRGGLLDLALTVAIVAAMVRRTPAGALLWWIGVRLSGDSAELPTLTALFESGATAPPVEALALAAPPTEPVGADQLPEPWRTGARTMLTEGVPDALGGTPEEALAAIDAAWRATGDPAAALEVALLGAATVDRAIARAHAAGEPEAATFSGHRRFLSPRDALAADRFVGGALALGTVLDLAWPLEIAHRLTSPFGERNHPTLGIRKFHEGVDLAVPVGTEVHTAQGGRLAVVGESAVSGKYVVVDHGYGVRTSYCHLSETPLARGSEVGRSDVVARSGNTGRSTGPHLHYGVKIAGRWVDPEALTPPTRRGPPSTRAPAPGR